MTEKNMIVALTISFILSGLGIAYAGDIKKGAGIFAVVIVLNIMGIWVNPIFSHISTIAWLAGLYLTYQEVKAVNGE